MPKVSIIIPVYNVEKYLANCLDSVINQTYKDIEIICVNDGSSDNSQIILDEYAQKDNRIKIVIRENGGLSAARNTGIDIANGQYCYFVDSDDWIDTNTIEKLINIIETNDVDVVVHNAISFSDSDINIKKVKFMDKWLDIFAWDDGIHDIPIEINKKICPVAWNKLYKMEIINKYNCRYPEGLINEDELFVWTYMIHCKNFYYLNEKLYHYIQRSDSIMAKKDKTLKALDILEIEEEVYKTVVKYKDIDVYREHLTNDYIEIVNTLFKRISNKYKKEAVKRIKKYSLINNDKKILKLYKKYKYIRLKQILSNIFSLKNSSDKKHKIITILGIKIKICNKCYKYDTFITIHDQDILLKLEKNKVFSNLKNYKYLFVGKKPVDKLKQYSNKIIVCRELPQNIEEYKTLLDFTGWYAVAKNNLCTKNYVCFLQYDYFVHNNFDKKITKTLKNNSDSILAFFNVDSDEPSFIDNKYSKGIKEACLKILNKDIRDYCNKLPEPVTVAFCNAFIAPKEILNQYIDWMEPLYSEISKDELAGHSVERSIGYFSVINNVKCKKILKVVEHIYAEAHNQSYDNKYTQKDRYQEFLSGEYNKQEKRGLYKKRLNNIFSIKNSSDKRHKIVTILGLKISLKRKNYKK